MSEGFSSSKRWYDQDPALSKALSQLRVAADKYQAQVALNIIKIVIEHQTEGSNRSSGELLDPDHLFEAISQTDVPHQQHERRRWYDVNETLRSAMQLLQDCPDDLQTTIVPSIVQMIEESLSQQP